MSLLTIKPVHLLETSQFIQDQLYGLDKTQAAIVWGEHRQLLGSRPTLAGANRVHIHTEVAMMISDGFSSEEAIYPFLQYGELAMKGFLSNVSMFTMNGQSTVMWMLSGAVLRDIHQRELELSNETNDSELINPLPVGVPIRRPLYAPAKLIHFAFPAE